MKSLVIDTSTAVMALALMDRDQCIAEYNMMVERRHSDELLPAIERLVGEAGLTLQQLDGIAVGQGPGSYTGVRIGVTAAKTLAWTLGLPLQGISSIEALAYGAACGMDELHGTASGMDETHGTACGTDEMHGAETALSDKSGGSDRESVDKVGDRAASLDERSIGDHAAGQRTWYIPLIDARRGRAYTALFVAEGLGAEGSRADGLGAEGLGAEGLGLPKSWERLAADQVQPVDDWFQNIVARIMQLPATDRPRQLVVLGETKPFKAQCQQLEAELAAGVSGGDGIDSKLESRVESRMESRVESRVESQWDLRQDTRVISFILQEQSMNAKALGQLAAARWDDGSATVRSAANIHRFVPNYAQLSQAEAAVLAERQQGESQHER